MIRFLLGTVAGLLLFNASAYAQADFGSQIADLEVQGARIVRHPRSGTVRLIGSRPQSPIAVPLVNGAARQW